MPRRPAWRRIMDEVKARFETGKQPIDGGKKIPDHRISDLNVRVTTERRDGNGHWETLSMHYSTEEIVLVATALLIGAGFAVVQHRKTPAEIEMIGAELLGIAAENYAALTPAERWALFYGIGGQELAAPVVPS